jgi:hypothetical protein
MKVDEEEKKEESKEENNINTNLENKENGSKADSDVADDESMHVKSMDNDDDSNAEEEEIKRKIKLMATMECPFPRNGIKNKKMTLEVSWSKIAVEYLV